MTHSDGYFRKEETVNSKERKLERMSVPGLNFNNEVEG